MIRCIAIDDEPLALELLEDNIGKVPFLQLVASCDSALDAMNNPHLATADLVFLDIQMPGLTGLQFIKSLSSKPLFIMITAYEKYALESFDLEVVDYLLKPVSFERFLKACNRAHEIFQFKQQDRSASSSAPDYLFVNVDYSLFKVMLQDIMFVEGLKDYIKIHLKSSPKAVITRMSMKNIEEALPAGQFVRVHKSFIVSLAHVTAIRKNSVFIGSNEIPVSESYPTAIQSITGKG